MNVSIEDGHIADPGLRAPSARSIPSLDGLRALSVAMVVLSHYESNSALPQHGWMHLLIVILGQGGTGVSIFFVISGFLITTLLLNERDRRGTISLRRFYLRRFFRIFPPFYVYLAVAAIVAWWRRDPLRPIAWMSAFAYVLNYVPYAKLHLTGSGWYVGHTWSLSVEEQFYLFWPALLLFIPRRRSISFCAGVLCVVPVLRVLTAYFLPVYRYQWSQLFHTTVDTIFAGCLIAFLLREEDGRRRLERVFHPAPLFAAAVILIFESYTARHAPLWLAGLYQSFTNLAACLLVAFCVMRKDSIAGRVLNLAWLRHIGILSYSIYLWQQIIINPMHGFNTPVRLLVVLLLAEASYWLVERPSLRLRQHLEDRRRACA